MTVAGKPASAYCIGVLDKTHGDQTARQRHVYTAQNDNRNLGRQGPASCATGTWPYGEGLDIRNAYDEMLRRTDDATTKVCYNCRGTGKSGGKQCTACNGSGSVPAAR
jgi:DnaJ-class molecular chaperone